LQIFSSPERAAGGKFQSTEAAKKKNTCYIDAMDVRKTRNEMKEISA